MRAIYGGGIHNGRLSLYVSSIAEDETMRFGPGDVLLYHIVREACRRRLRVLDLGAGDADYKKSWCNETVPLFDLTQPMTMKGRAVSSVLRLAGTAKARIKSTPVLWNAVQKLRRVKGSLRAGASATSR